MSPHKLLPIVHITEHSHTHIQGHALCTHPRTRISSTPSTVSAHRTVPVRSAASPFRSASRRSCIRRFSVCSSVTMETSFCVSSLVRSSNSSRSWHAQTEMTTRCGRRRHERQTRRERRYWTGPESTLSSSRLLKWNEILKQCLRIFGIFRITEVWLRYQPSYQDEGCCFKLICWINKWIGGRMNE